MVVKLLLFSVSIGFTVCVWGCASHYVLPARSVGVPSLWCHYFGGPRLKSLGTAVVVRG